MRKEILLFIFFFGITYINAQESVQATSEVLAKIPIGTNPSEASYKVNEEGFYSIGSPFVDSRGGIVFYSTMNGKNFIELENGKRLVFPYVGNLSDYREDRSRNYNSQQGILYDHDPLLFGNYHFFEYNFRKNGIKLIGSGYNLYPAPFGALYFSEKEKAGIAIVFDIHDPNEDFLVIDQGKLKAWLADQRGGFSIGEDGFLYRNNLRWSAIPPKDWEGSKFLGRLKSDHMLWGVGTLGMESWFLITNAKSQIELQFSLPWRFKDGLETNTYFNFGVGPWGELYCLIAPPLLELEGGKARGDGPPPEMRFDDTKPAELVVVRNHLKYFGRLNDGGVRLRKEPNTSSEILGTYPNKTGFRILERTGKEETIAGQKSDWVKVRLLDGKEGWFFGSFVHNLYDGPNGKAPPWPNVPDW